MTLTETILHQTAGGRAVAFEAPPPGVYGVKVRVTRRHAGEKAEAAQIIDDGTLYAARFEGDDVLALVITTCGQRLTDAGY